MILHLQSTRTAFIVAAEKLWYQNPAFACGTVEDMGSGSPVFDVQTAHSTRFLVH